MVRYCFKERRRYALFAEIVARAVLAVARDFPRFVTHEESVERASSLCDELQQETCCIKRAQGLYRQMVKSCYVSVYESQQQATERELVLRFAYFKAIPDDDVALPIVRIGLEDAAARAMIEAAYAQFFSFA